MSALPYDARTTDHDVLVWGPNPEGGKTSRGEVLTAGWVWTCSCKNGRHVGTGFPTEAAADEAAEFHVLGALMDGVS